MPLGLAFSAVARSARLDRLLPAWLVGDEGWRTGWDRHRVLLAIGVALLAAVLAGAARSRTAPRACSR